MSTGESVLIGLVVGLLVAWAGAKLNEVFNTRLLIRNKTLNLRIDLMAALLDWEFEVSPLVSMMQTGRFDRKNVTLAETVNQLSDKESTFVRRKALSIVYLKKVELEAVSNAMVQLRLATIYVRQKFYFGPGAEIDRFDHAAFEGDLRNARLVLGQPLGVAPDVLAAQKDFVEKMNTLRR